MSESEMTPARDKLPQALVFRCEPGKDYRLNELPRDAAGQVLYQGESAEEYQAYVSWLADYLHAARVEPGPRQADLCRQIQGMSKENAISQIAMIAGLDDMPASDVCDAMMERLTHLSDYTEADVEWIYQRALELRREHEAEDSGRRSMNIVASVDLTPDITREAIQQFLEQEREAKLLCDCADSHFCDIPWRIPLSLVLSDVSDHEERVRLLNVFFETFREYMWK